METFNLYKLNYIQAKQHYLDAVKKHRRALNRNDYPNGETEKDEVCARYKREREEAHISIVNAATMMVGYIAHSVMDKLDDDGICALVEGYPDIKDRDQPTFKFEFNYAVSYPIENFEGRSPELNELYQQVQFGYIKVDEAVKLLEQAKIPVSDIGGLENYSDDIIMSCGMKSAFNLIERDTKELYEELSDNYE